MGHVKSQPLSTIWQLSRTLLANSDTQREARIDTIIMQIYDFNTCNW